MQEIWDELSLYQDWTKWNRKRHNDFEVSVHMVILCLSSADLV